MFQSLKEKLAALRERLTSGSEKEPERPAEEPIAKEPQKPVFKKKKAAAKALAAPSERPQKDDRPEKQDVGGEERKTTEAPVSGPERIQAGGQIEKAGPDSPFASGILGWKLHESRLDGLLWELEVALLESDVALPAIDAIKKRVKKDLLDRRVKLGTDVAGVVEDALKDAITAVLTEPVPISSKHRKAPSRFEPPFFNEFIDKKPKPVVLMFVGINGTGKTTSIAKICFMLQKQGYSCVIGAGDTVEEATDAGIDTVQSAVAYTLAANVEALILTGTSAIDGTGNSLDNTLWGFLNSAANVLTGGAGHENYYLGAGDSVVEAANEGWDTVWSWVSTTLSANVEALALAGTEALDGTGNALDNTLTGNTAANVLDGAGGADVLAGGLGDDTYWFNWGDGQDMVQENDTTQGNSDTVLFGNTVDPIDLVLSRQGNDLQLALHDSTDRLTIQNWYSGAGYQAEVLQAGNGDQLLSSQVDDLIQAMATFCAQNGLTWDQAIDQRPQDVQTILAANWQ